MLILKLKVFICFLFNTSLILLNECNTTTVALHTSKISLILVKMKPKILKLMYIHNY